MTEPLYNSVADEPMADHAVCMVLTQLLEIVRKRDTFEPILPEMIMADGEGEISLRKDDFRPAATSSAFLPPEAAAWTAQPELSQREAAYAWNMGMVVYTLLAGYPPFASTSASECPFFADFQTLHRLACPPHFTTSAIAVLMEMLSLEPEQRAKLNVLQRSCIDWRRSAVLPDVTPTEKKQLNRSEVSSNVTARFAALAVRSNTALPASTSAEGSTAAGALNSSGGGLSSSSLLPQPAWTLSATEADDSFNSAKGKSSNGSSNGGSVNASPLAEEPKRLEEIGAAGAGAVIGAGSSMPPPPSGMGPPADVATFCGPHGASAAQICRALVAHPNSPLHSMSSALTRPSRPVAVVYSPISELPRKVPMNTAMRKDGAVSARGARVKVKRLGWEVVHAEGVSAILEQITGVLSEMSVIFEVQEPKEHGMRILTAPTHITDGMGAGIMQAAMLLSPVGVSSPLVHAGTASERTRWRIDVSRVSGDTFQFHAFYREIRDKLLPLFMAGSVPGSSAATASSCSKPALVEPDELLQPPTHNFWGARKETSSYKRVSSRSSQEHSSPSHVVPLA